ncbi:hypothetical protein [Cytobacillus sp. FSL K6-0265]
MGKYKSWLYRNRISRNDYALTWNAALEMGGVLVGDKIKLVYVL